MIDAELARQTDEATAFYMERQRARAEGRTPPPWPAPVKAWRDMHDAARAKETLERRLALEREAESPEAQRLFASTEDAVAAIAEGMTYLYGVVTVSAKCDLEALTKLVYALVAVKSGRYPIEDCAIADDLVDGLDRLRAFARSKNAQLEPTPQVRELADKMAACLLGKLMTLWARAGLRV